MPATRGNYVALLGTKYQQVLEDVGPERPIEYPTWLKVRDMTVNPENWSQVSGLGFMQTKSEGTQFPTDQPIMGGTISPEAVPYGMLFEVSFEMYDDDQYEIMASQWQQMGRSARDRQEQIAIALLNNAFNNSFSGYDGVSLCNTAHPLLGGGTGANRGTTDFAFSHAGLQNASFRFEARKNQRGLKALTRPQRILIDPSNKYLIREILGSSGKSQTADNDTNAFIEDDYQWKVLHYLTTSTTWFMVSSMADSDAYFLWRNRPIPDHFPDPLTMNADFSLYQRATAAFGDWIWIDGSTGA